MQINFHLFCLVFHTFCILEFYCLIFFVVSAHKINTSLLGKMKNERKGEERNCYKHLLHSAFFYGQV